MVTLGYHELVTMWPFSSPRIHVTLWDMNYRVHHLSIRSFGQLANRSPRVNVLMENPS